MGRLTRWARAGIAVGSLVAVQTIIVVTHVTMPTGRAHGIGMALTILWAILMALTTAIWYTRAGGTTAGRIHLVAIVLGALASVTLTANAPEAVLARVGEAVPVTVVAESLDPLGGSGAYHYVVEDASGRRIPGEIHDSFDSYDVGSQVVVLVDPRGKVELERLPLASSQRWRSVTQGFTIVALVLTIAAVMALFFMGYGAPRTRRGR